VDPVTVERERGVAEEKNRVGRDGPPPWNVHRRILAAWRLVALSRLHLFAEHRPALVLDGEAVRPADSIDDGREHQRAGAATLHADVRQLGLATERVADPDGAMEVYALAGEHPARQRDRRHDTGVVRCAVPAQLVRRIG